ncbi:uncharacterized protein DDB_G0292186-like isoform X2 [Pectinophora gossypiella]|uniref:uncharacterized protein DDB_G0292186-like isoform X2 n=1 Tax=Pectinophora gossypiella TaxID=13191 RepID=UPI00214F052C|nr:uncharacterized protein DDB_G0292186-like isoform X2 [Pectinophora gossypiella]
MRLHALLLTALVLRARAASLPDKTDVEKKLTDVVKEVLDKDKPVDNVSSEQELIDQTNVVKEIENNLRNNAQIADIPVKVVVEDVQPSVKNDGDKKEDNEVAPASEESAEIKRPEIDIKNPGPPQHMEHDTQNPEHFEDVQQVEALKVHALNGWWRSSPQYDTLQKELQTLKDNFDSQIVELTSTIQKYWGQSAQPSEPEKPESNDSDQKEIVKLRASVKADGDTASSTAAPPSSGFPPFIPQFIQNWSQQFTENINKLNQTFASYVNNQTNQFNVGNGINNTNNANCGGPFSGFLPGSNQPAGAQSDDPRPPGLWQNIQNFFSGQPQPPAPVGAQADTPQAQPNRPVISAIQNAIQTGVNYLRPPGQAPAPQQSVNSQPPKPVTQEGSNAVPVESKPENEKPKEKPVAQAQPAQQVTQSGPIKQLIGNNPIAQGIVGAVQRIQHTIIPVKPRDEEVKKPVDAEAQATKGGLFYKPVKPINNSGASGDNNNDGSGVVVKSVPDLEKQDVDAKEPVKEEIKDPAVPEKTE